jgi:Tetratricopeptide repeat/NB-ARC domain
VQISAISGMGGIGKSELALQYVYRHVQSTYPGGVMWLKAREDIGLQILDWARLYANLVSPENYKIAEQIKLCWRQWWNAATLIVFDDVQQYAAIDPFLPPPSSQFRTLLASRQKFSSPVRTYEIKVLNEAAAIELLRSFAPELWLRVDADLATAQEICGWLGYLPNHPSTATSLNNLAGLYRSIGRYAEAEPLSVRAVAIVEDKLGIDHPNTQTIHKNLQILRQQLVQPQQQPEQPRLNWWQRLRGKLR